MPTITTKDGTQIYYKDWGKGQPIVFSHGWPLTADDWDGQMLFFGQHGYRVIAHDRRGHGRSTQTWDGNDMDTYADDLAAAHGKARPEERNPRRPLHRRRGGCALYRPSRLQACRHGRAHQRCAAPNGEDGKKSRGRSDRGLRRPASGVCREIGRSFTGTSLFRSTATTGPAPRFRKASGTSGGCRG